MDYCSLRPVRVETPALVFTRHRFVFEDGVGRVLDDKRRVLLSAVGTVERTGGNLWVFTTGPFDWVISGGTGGCNCQKPAVVAASVP